MTKMQNKIDEIVLKPAHWRYDDYQKAKTQLIALIEEICNEVIKFDAELLVPNVTWANEPKHVREYYIDATKQITAQQRAKLKDLLK